MQRRVCPACGASVEGERCAYCGATLVDKRPAPVNLTINVRSPVRRQSKGWLAVAVALGAAVGICAAGLVAVRRPSSMPGMALGQRRELTRLCALTSDLLLGLYFDGEGKYRLGATNAGRLLWETSGAGDESAQSEVCVGPSKVFWAYGSQVQALQRATGKLVWQASLATDLSLGSGPRTALLGDKLAVLERDGTVQAFASETGQQVWHHRYQPSTGRLLSGSGHLLVQASEQVWAVVDSGKGKTLSSVALKMGRTSAGSDACWVLSPDGGTAGLIYGLLDRFAANLSMRDGKLLWCRRLPDNFPVPVGAIYPAPVIEGDQLWSADGHDLFSIDLPSGRARRAYHAAEDRLSFVCAAGPRVIVASHPDWDPSAWSLRCIQGGNWSYKVKAKSLLGGPGLSDWAVVRRGDHLTLVQALANPSRLTVDRIAISTGVGDVHQERPFPAYASPSLSNVLIQGNQLAARCADRSVRVALDTGLAQ